MRWSLPISLLIHAAILLSAIVVLPSPDHYKVAQQESIPVELISVSDLSKRKAAQKEPVKKEPKKKPKKIKVEKKIDKVKPTPKKEVKQAVSKPEPKPAPAPKPEPKSAEPSIEDILKETVNLSPDPKPEPKPDAKKKAQSKPVPKPRVKPKPPARIARKTKKKKNELNVDDVAALLNKIEGSTAPAPSQEAPADKRASAGSDDSISANELDWLRQRIGLCWNIPAGVRDAESLVVIIDFQLDQSGQVIGAPAVKNQINHPAFPAAARSALAAIVGCQPYDQLPPEKYDSWKVIRMNFDPSQMLAIN